MSILLLLVSIKLSLNLNSGALLILPTFEMPLQYPSCSSLHPEIPLEYTKPELQRCYAHAPETCVGPGTLGSKCFQSTICYKYHSGI